ncbi:arabinosyltransferase ARAD1 [Tripterygium wilfordii]|uniref:Arabinosyltransferase ARAD1 n=1 Tax=Tripterygium wilfordii TaxID=458696 RepID=A0A7J7C946_TRIWF|nr:probable arabinosyltransferase ARAD1 [Tripterygium wilfordii]KAF5730691.1 arabinosyltransferase ARAD1 [Tripterygium wilfordii]
MTISHRESSNPKMAMRNNVTVSRLCSIPALFILILTLLSLSLLVSVFFFTKPTTTTTTSSRFHTAPSFSQDSIKVFVADLPRSLNYGLLNQYWSESLPDSRIGTDLESRISMTHLAKTSEFPPYPENPLIKQYSAEYWILGDLMTPQEKRNGSFARRVLDYRDADVVFVPFFATLSAEMQLSREKGVFRKKAGNEDYKRQREVLDLIKNSEAWKRSGGKDHVFVLTDPVAMWHVREEIAPAILLVVDFGGWYRLDSKSSNGSSPDKIHHTHVSLLKDVIVPYTHLLPRFHLPENQKRHTLLYFKGAKHRHRGGIVREQLWDLLVNEPGVIMEEGFPNATGKEQSIKGMRTSAFCLHPAGDTPTSCRLFDAIQSLCIPIIVSDNIELPFEGMVDYLEFSVFVSVSDALRPNWLVSHLRSISEERRNEFRQNIVKIQPIFEYDNGHPGGVGPIPPDGAVNHIWRKVHQKLPMIKEAIVRERRKPPGVSIPLRCHCT